MSITGERLRIQRKRCKLRADQVATELGVSRSTIFRYENGYIEKVPSSLLEDLARILYTTPSYLAGWTDDYHDWERIGNEKGIYPPKDYDGSYEDYVKYKMQEQQSAFIDEHYDTSSDDDIPHVSAKEAFGVKPQIVSIPNTENTSFAVPTALAKYVSLLNKKGVSKVTDYAKDLSMTPLYQRDPEELLLNAAHERTDIEVTPDMLQADEDIMDDENF